VGAGKSKDGDVVVAMMQTLYRRPEILKNFNLFIVDEVHLAAADSWYNTLLQSNAYYRYGQSGTVFREDNADIRFYANTGPLFYHVPIKEMWAQDVIMKPKVKWIRFQTPRLNNAVPYTNVYQLGIVENEARNGEVVKLTKKLSAKESILVSVERMEHLEKS
jgi:superfamily II DNA or RNA helicase